MLSARESSGRKPTLLPRSRPQAARNSGRRAGIGAGIERNRKATRGMAEPVYRRVVIKLSGEYLAGSQGSGIEQAVVDRIAGDLIQAQKLGVEIAVVVGGGNLIRGVEVSSRGVSRQTGDTMGMLATVMNSLSLEAAVERKGGK